jgi:nucleoside-diphosphate kinase
MKKIAAKEFDRKNLPTPACALRAIRIGLFDFFYFLSFTLKIKPDGVQRGLVGSIIGRFEKKGYKLQAMKTKQATSEILEQHYKDLVEKPFFPKLKEYMLSGPVVCMVWQGKEAVSTGRKMLGATNPLESAPGTIRGDFCIEVGRNICHGSDSVENAEREIGLWFDESELLDWDSHSYDWIYE